MEFFGISLHGPQNYIRDCIKPEYQEPLSNKDVEKLMKNVIETSTCSEKLERPDTNVIRLIDCYIGRVNGFAYGSSQRFNKMKRKGVVKPVGPNDMYRIPVTTSTEYGWWQCDPVLIDASWHVTYPRHPQPVSQYTRVLDLARKNNKYATLF